MIPPLVLDVQPHHAVRSSLQSHSPLIVEGPKLGYTAGSRYVRRSRIKGALYQAFLPPHGNTPSHSPSIQ